MATEPATKRLPNIKGWVYDDEDSYCRVEDEESREMVTDAYDPAKTYKKGETSIQDNKLYRAKADITTAEIWTPDHWEETSLETIRAEMASELSALNASQKSEKIAVWNGLTAEFYTKGSIGFCYISGMQTENLTTGAKNQYIQIPEQFWPEQFLRVQCQDQDGHRYLVDITDDGKFGVFYVLTAGGTKTNWYGSFSYPLRNR